MSGAAPGAGAVGAPTAALVEGLEAQLVAVVLAGDVAALGALLAGDAVFIDQQGRRVGRDEDLAIHAAGALRVERFDVAARRILLLADAALVTFEASLAGTAGAARFAGRYAYSRLWRCGEAGWQVAAAHCSGPIPG